MLKSLSPRNTTGLDDPPSRFIRDGAEGIAHPISYIINLSLKTGVVPDEMKTASHSFVQKEFQIRAG